MAPLKTKLNDTFSKIRDRFDRDRDRGNRHLQDEASLPSAAQPRTLLSGSIPASLPWTSPPGGNSWAPLTSAKPVPDSSVASSGKAAVHAKSRSQSSSTSMAYTSSPVSSVPGPRLFEQDVENKAGSSRGGKKTIAAAFSTARLPQRRSWGIHLNSVDPTTTSAFSAAGPSKGDRADMKNVKNSAAAAQLLQDEEMAAALQAEFMREGESLSPYDLCPSFGIEFDSGPQPNLLNQEPLVRSGDLRLDCNIAGEDVLQEYGRRVLGLECGKCLRPLITGGGDVVRALKDMLEKRCSVQPGLTCTKCDVSSFIDCTHVRNGSTSHPDAITRHCRTFRVSWCGDEGRLFLLWALCCGPEFEEPANPRSPARTTFNRVERLSVKNKFGRSKSTAHERSVSHGSLTKRLSRPAGVSNGTGYGGEEDRYPFMALVTVAGVGFAGTSSGPPRWPPLQSIAKKDDKVEDALWETYFRAAAVLLPSHDGETGFDIEPPSILVALLKRSPLLLKAAELVRNDSLVEIGAKEHLYNGLFDFLEALGAHTMTSMFIYEDLIRHPPEDQLVYVSLRDASFPSTRLSGAASTLRSKQKSVAKAPDKTQSLTSLVGSLSLQCNKVHRAAMSHADTFESEDEQRLLVLCRRILDLADHFKVNAAVGGRAADLDAMNRNDEGLGAGDSSTPRLTPTPSARAHLPTQSAWHRAHCVSEIQDDKILDNFHFACDANALLERKMAIQPGRMKKLISEIAMMATSLPDGIYVRHGASRLDVMKVLVVGPMGTPYEGGLFEFDLFCPETYPQLAPMVNFRTTGHGLVRFNPNLYEDGKVCLSLLGTWSGEPWRPNESTILQILVSIQAMILNAEPWYNEPGRERMTNKVASEAYNGTIQQYTLQHAILYWLSDRLASHSGKDKALTLGNSSTGCRPEGVNGGVMADVDAKLKQAASNFPIQLAPYKTVGPSGSSLQDPIWITNEDDAPYPTAVVPWTLPSVEKAAEPRPDDAVWGEVIRQHFALNGRAILDTTKKWKCGRQVAHMSRSHATLVTELESALKSEKFL